jgi:hypothetical protein
LSADTWPQHGQVRLVFCDGTTMSWPLGISSNLKAWSRCIAQSYSWSYFASSCGGAPSAPSFPAVHGGACRAHGSISARTVSRLIRPILMARR